MIKKRKKGLSTPTSQIFPGLTHGPKASWNVPWRLEFLKPDFKSIGNQKMEGCFDPLGAARFNALIEDGNYNSIKMVVLDNINSPSGQFLLLEGQSIQ